MLLSLCLRLGIPSLRHLYACLTSREIATWIAFYMLDPFDSYREDLRAGIIAQVIGNAFRDSQKKPEPFDASDFMPTFRKPWDTTGGDSSGVVELTVEQSAQLVRMSVAMGLGKIVK